MSANKLTTGNGNLASAEDDEINASLPERFRKGFITSSNSSPITTSRSRNVVLNLDIRKYVREANNLTKSSSIEWVQQPEIPKGEEISCNEKKEILLAPNKIKGSYKKKERYLKTHFKLLREDAISPLRGVVELFRRTPQMMEDDRGISIYEKVHIIGFTFAPLGIAARVRFSTTRAGKAIPWKYSKRLLSGSMVALTPAKDNFKTKCIIAIIAARPLLGVQSTPPEIDIYFSSAEEIEIDPQVEWTMVEAKQGYYEGSRYTLRALQKLSQESFPLSKHICGLMTELDRPMYRSEKPEVDLSVAFKDADPIQKMQNVHVLRDWPTSPEGNFDNSQWAALEQILTRSLSIIQGPPGTGKTHVSKVALQILVKNLGVDDPPIIIAAHTNHALDQLLRHVADFEPNFIRLGGRSTKSDIRMRALYEVRQKDRRPPIPGGLLGKANARMKALVNQMIETLSPLQGVDDGCTFSPQTLLNLGVLSENQARSLEAGARQWVTAGDLESQEALQLWLDKALIRFEVVYKADNYGFDEDEIDLEYEQATEAQAEMGVTDDEDIENLKGRWCSVHDGFTVAKASNAALEIATELLDSTPDLWKVRQALRGPMYLIIKQRAKEATLAKFRHQAKEYHQIVSDIKIGRWERDAVYLQEAKVIGMTTTGLSKYRPLVSSLKPKIILIEEAAEVIEAPVAVACVESLEHLILVGDHKQLQGHCNDPALENDPYYLNISMFERLVTNDIPFRTLVRQRRMDPEFRRLIMPIYPQLEDHPDVINRPGFSIGLGEVKSFFLHHEGAESKDTQLSSFNDSEAEFIAGFYQYLLENSANPRGITILTFYNGQRKRILSHIKKRHQIGNQYANVLTVDSYQGEENGIIILSLVRNNEYGNIGFLQVANRVCVALSRAKLGFYIFGNAKLLAAASPLWRNVIQIMSTNPNRVGNKFPLVCKNHGRQTSITYPGDWRGTNGGCDLPCPGELSCGHPCPLKCHPFPHEDLACKQTCQKTLVCGHQCIKSCSEKPCHCDCEQFRSNRVKDDEKDSDDMTPLSQRTLKASHNGNKTNHVQNGRGGNGGPAPSMSKHTENNSFSTQSNHQIGLSTNKHASNEPSSSFLKDGFGKPKMPASQYASKVAGSISRSTSTSSGLSLSLASGSQHSREKQAHMRQQWASFAAGGVKNSDRLRERRDAEKKAELREKERQLAAQQPPLIDFGGEDVQNKSCKREIVGVKEEKVTKMKGGRNRFEHRYQPSSAQSVRFGDGSWTSTTTINRADSPASGASRGDEPSLLD